MRIIGSLLARLRNGATTAVENALKAKLLDRDVEILELSEKLAIQTSTIAVRDAEVRELQEAHAHSVERWRLATSDMAAELKR